MGERGNLKFKGEKIKIEDGKLKFNGKLIEKKCKSTLQ